MPRGSPSQYYFFPFCYSYRQFGSAYENFVHSCVSHSRSNIAFWYGRRTYSGAGSVNDSSIRLSARAFRFSRIQRHFFTAVSSSHTDSAPTDPEASATLVTAYYPLSAGSKHTIEKYKRWMGNFLPYVRANLVVYLPPDRELENSIRQLRGDLPLIIRVCGLRCLAEQWYFRKLLV